ncbi:hypothetical protein [Prevotella jejuni]|nr:hypothetical protein [Prevotella jejuni]
MERTTERFDTSTYYMERQGHEYQFEHYLRGKVRQFGGDNGSNYIEYARKDNSLFGTCKEYYNKTGTLKLVGKYYYNRFNAGIWKEYDENGYLIDEYDQDAPYKNYPWEKVEKFVKEELKLDLFDNKVFIHRYVSKHSKIPIWRIRWQVGIKVYTIKINANTGKIINQVEGEVEK